MSESTRVLFLAPVEPWCRENGSSLITADLLEALSSLDDIELLPIFMRTPPTGYNREAPDDLECLLLDIEGLPRWLSIMKAVALNSTPLRHRFDNRKVRRAVEDVLSQRDFRPDVLHVEHLPLVDIGVSLARRLGRPVVYRAHNVESHLWSRRLQLSGPLKSWSIEHMERREADAVRMVDLALWISERDREWARAKVPEARSEILPCTLRLSRYDAVAKIERRFSAQVCFVGGLDWAPNEDGLRWFVQEVLPSVTRALPEAGLAVLARGAHRRTWLSANPAVQILPSEMAAAQLFASSHVSVAPLFQGGGVRIKIPESLALECPVVATPIGAEGHDLPGLIRTEDPEEFADACIALLKQSSATRPQTLRPRVEALYGASVQAGRLARLWEQTMRRAGVGRDRSDRS